MIFPIKIEDEGSFYFREIISSIGFNGGDILCSLICLFLEPD